jgi:hypothetical protein
VHVNCVAGPLHPENDFIAIGTHLGEFHETGLNQHKVVDGLALREQHAIAGKRSGPGAGKDISAFEWREPCKERRGAQEPDLIGGIME